MRQIIAELGTARRWSDKGLQAWGAIDVPGHKPASSIQEELGR